MAEMVEPVDGSLSASGVPPDRGGSVGGRFCCGADEGDEARRFSDACIAKRETVKRCDSFLRLRFCPV